MVIYDTLTTIGQTSIVVTAGPVSILIALLGQSNSATWAGLIYMLLAPMIMIFRMYRGRVRRRHLVASLTQAAVRSS